VLQLALRVVIPFCRAFLAAPAGGSGFLFLSVRIAWAEFFMLEALFLILKVVVAM
jgi:hypothetical protein